jgi:predicted DNA-binding protein
MAKDATVTLRMSNDLKQALQILAVKDRRTLSSYIEVVLERHAYERLDEHRLHSERVNVFRAQTRRHAKKKEST